MTPSKGGKGETAVTVEASANDQDSKREAQNCIPQVSYIESIGLSMPN